MTHQPEEVENTAVELPGVETPATRRVRPVLALVAGLVEFGLGYVYVGRIRLALTCFAAFYGIIAFFSWTRLVMYSATVWLLAWVICLLVIGIVLIHPVILATKHRRVPLKPYNRWWFYIVWTVAGTGFTILVGANRTTLFGYEPFRVLSASMSPTAELDDFVLADTWRYRNHAAMVGEIVIVERPENPGVKYIKRVVAVSGDSVELTSPMCTRQCLMREVRETFPCRRSDRD
jgi:hypothetical protein